MARFDHVIESSKIGIRKPDPRIYTMMCAALGVEPAQCIYLDDLGINCKPAAAMGMAAIKVTSGEQALGRTLCGFGVDARAGWRLGELLLLSPVSQEQIWPTSFTPTLPQRWTAS